MKTRRAVAVIVSRFPLVTETFVLREIEEMERQGQPVLLVPLLRERPAVVHREAEPWVARALYTPFLSAAIVSANLRALRRDPGRCLSLLAGVLRGNALSANFLARALALFPKCVLLARRLREEGVGHLHAHFATHPALAAYVISSLTGIPYSFTAHAHDLFVRRTFLREKVRAARFVRVISRFNRDFLASLCPDMPAAKIRVIHTGLDPARYRQGGAAAGEQGAEQAGPARILCVAALKAYKGLPVLIEACRLLRDDGLAFVCDIVGEGPLRRQVEAAIEARGLAGTVRLLGARRQDEVTPLMAAASLVVLPSTVAPDGQMDGIPVSLMEALASARPVVASRLSGIPELVHDGVNGLLVPPDDAPALAAAIRRLLGDSDLARRMGDEGRETVEAEYTLEACVSSLLEAIAAESEPVSPALDESLHQMALDACAVGVRRVLERPESTVAELVVSGGGRSREANGHGRQELVLKLHRAHPPSESARREFEVLCRLAEGFGEDAAYGVPRALRFHESAAALLMQRCHGRPLDQWVRALRWSRSPGDRGTLVSALRRTGRWLRLFQPLTARQADAGLAQAALLARARRDLESCAVHGLSARFLRTVRGRLERLGSIAPPHRLVEQQGDFWPGNVYVDEETVQVIDFEGYCEGLPYEDPAYFLVQLGLFFAYPLVREGLAPLEAAFLDGYLEGEALDRGAWELCLTAKALQVLAQSLSSQADTGSRGWWRRRTLRALALGRGM